MNPARIRQSKKSIRLQRLRRRGSVRTYAARTGIGTGSAREGIGA